MEKCRESPPPRPKTTIAVVKTTPLTGKTRCGTAVNPNFNSEIGSEEKTVVEEFYYLEACKLMSKSFGEVQSVAGLYSNLYINFSTIVHQRFYVGR
ncbi:hypothetical protein ABFS82_09G063800 [Erythranthe guttata]